MHGADGKKTTDASFIGHINPLRYRGYYYDAETGFYYVSSRYYDPELIRWISPEPNIYMGGFDSGAGLIGYVVINKTGQVITAYTSKYFDANMQKIVERLYGK